MQGAYDYEPSPALPPARRRKGATVPTIVAYHDVDDTEHWLASPKREEFFGPLGVTNIRTFTNPQNPTQVALMLDVPDLDALMTAMQTPEAAATMQHDGVRPDTLVILVDETAILRATPVARANAPAHGPPGRSQLLTNDSVAIIRRQSPKARSTGSQPRDPARPRASSRSRRRQAGTPPAPSAPQPSREVELDAEISGLDGGPQSPADVGHDHVETHAGEQGSSGLAEVGGAQLGLGLVEAQLLGCVAELKRRVVDAAVLEIDDPKPWAIVDVVVGQQVVVAWDPGSGWRARAASMREHGRGRRGSRPGCASSRWSTGRDTARTTEHVETGPEPRAGVQATERVGDAGGHARRPGGVVGHGPAVDPLEHDDLPAAGKA